MRLISISVVTATLLLCSCSKQTNEAATTPAQAQAEAKETRSLLDRLVSGDKPANASTTIEAVVSDLQIGSAVDSSGLVLTPSAVFNSKDSIYASAVIEQIPAGTVLSAEWRKADGSVLSRSEQTISSEPPHLAKFSLANKNPWEPGEYQFVLLAGKQEIVGSKFKVE